MGYSIQDNKITTFRPKLGNLAKVLISVLNSPCAKIPDTASYKHDFSSFEDAIRYFSLHQYMSFVNFRFFNYPGQPGLSSAPPVIPNILPVSPNVAISSQLPLTHPQGSCLPSYVDYSQHSEHPAELSPILQLENLGRHFENR